MLVGERCDDLRLHLEDLDIVILPRIVPPFLFPSVPRHVISPVTRPVLFSTSIRSDSLNLRASLDDLEIVLLLFIRGEVDDLLPLLQLDWCGPKDLRSLGSSSEIYAMMTRGRVWLLSGGDGQVAERQGNGRARGRRRCKGSRGSSDGVGT
jgi:hypothetical protein